MADMKVKGRGAGPAGTRCHLAKLDWDKVRRMRERYAAGDSVSNIARDFGIVRGTVRFVVTGKTWKAGDVRTTAELAARVLSE